MAHRVGDTADVDAEVAKEFVASVAVPGGGGFDVDFAAVRGGGPGRGGRTGTDRCCDSDGNGRTDTSRAGGAAVRDKLQIHFAEADGLAVGEGGFAHGRVVDKRAVGGAEVANGNSAIRDVNLAMRGRNRVVRDRVGRGRVAAEHGDARFEGDFPGLIRVGIDDELGHRRSEFRAVMAGWFERKRLSRASGALKQEESRSYVAPCQRWHRNSGLPSVVAPSSRSVRTGVEKRRGGFWRRCWRPFRSLRSDRNRGSQPRAPTPEVSVF